MNEMVRITARDMVAVALKPLKAGENVSYGSGSVTLKDDIPMGHKAALRDIRKGEAVIKYGFPIGEATEDIPAGGHVHTHNLHTLLKGEQAYEWHPAQPEVHRTEPAVFRGYPREKGRPGIRNELWILPTVTTRTTPGRSWRTWPPIRMPAGCCCWAWDARTAELNRSGP